MAEITTRLQGQTDPANVKEISPNNEQVDNIESPVDLIRKPPQRLHFLDNIKIVLTALVLTYHVSCALGGCDDSWSLVVGDYSCMFQRFNQSFTLLNQAYFMQLFFFISAFSHQQVMIGRDEKHSYLTGPSVSGSQPW